MSENQTDPLSVLQSVVGEILKLREDSISNRLFFQNLSIRLGLVQIKHGPLTGLFDNNDVRWEKLSRLASDNRLSVCSDGTVLLDHQILTDEILTEAITKTYT